MAKKTPEISVSNYLQTRPLTKKEILEQILIELRKISRDVEAIKNRGSITITPNPSPAPWTVPWKPSDGTGTPWIPTYPPPVIYCNNAFTGDGSVQTLSPEGIK
jgi:hypothetical protein